MFGMSYSVQLAKAARQKIVGWQLPPEGMRAILQRMDELSENPGRHLIRVGSSVHILEADVVYRDPGPPPLYCLITLSVRYGVDEETLHIVDCDRLFDDKVDQAVRDPAPLPPEKT
jgi:hypothetical protein